MWNATSFVPGKAQWNNPHATLLVETAVGQMVGHLPGQGCRRLASAKGRWAIQILRLKCLRSSSSLSLLCLPHGRKLYIMGSLSDPGLACRSSESIELYWNQDPGIRHMWNLQCLGMIDKCICYGCGPRVKGVSM